MKFFLTLFLLTFAIVILMIAILNFFTGMFGDWYFNLALAFGNALTNAIIYTFFNPFDSKKI